MKFLVLTDIHVADKPPLGRTVGYVDQIFAKLEECRAIAQNVDVTLILGDLFHAKRPTYNSHRLVQRLIKLFADWPGQKYAIAGNHDLAESGLASIDAQPLGVLFEAGVLTWLEKDVILDADIAVQISPANYVDDIDTDPSHYTLTRDPTVDVAMKLAHGMLVSPGEFFPFEHTPYDAVPTKGTDLILYGHPHYDAGATLIKNCWFASFGSLSRVARTPENLVRTPRVLTLDITKSDTVALKRDGYLPEKCFQPIALKNVAYGEEAFLPQVDAEGHEVELTEPIKNYAAALLGAIQHDSSERSLDELLATVAHGVAKPVQERVKQYLLASGY